MSQSSWLTSPCHKQGMVSGPWVLCLVTHEQIRSTSAEYAQTNKEKHKCTKSAKKRAHMESSDNKHKPHTIYTLNAHITSPYYNNAINKFHPRSSSHMWPLCVGSNACPPNERHRLRQRSPIHVSWIESRSDSYSTGKWRYYRAAMPDSRVSGILSSVNPQSLRSRFPARRQFRKFETEGASPRPRPPPSAFSNNRAKKSLGKEIDLQTLPLARRASRILPFARRTAAGCRRVSSISAAQGDWDWKAMATEKGGEKGCAAEFDDERRGDRLRRLLFESEKSGSVGSVSGPPWGGRGSGLSSKLPCKKEDCMGLFELGKAQGVSLEMISLLLLCARSLDLVVFLNHWFLYKVKIWPQIFLQNLVFLFTERGFQ